MAVIQAPRQQSNWGGIISTLVSMMPGMQWVAPAYAAANGIASGNPGQIASGIAGGIGQMQAPTPDAGGGMVAPAFTGGPDATDRMQMNKGLMNDQVNQRNQLDSRFNEILGQYNITPEGDVDQSKWDGLMRSYPSIFGYQRGR